MSNFVCEKCGAPHFDSPLGYATGCEHYPFDKTMSTQTQLAATPVREPEFFCQGCQKVRAVRIQIKRKGRQSSCEICCALATERSKFTGTTDTRRDQNAPIKNFDYAKQTGIGRVAK